MAQDIRNDVAQASIGDTPSMLELAALLALAVSAWLYGIHVVLLGESETLVGHLAHVMRDALLALPLAALSVAVGRRLARRWGIGELSGWDRLGVAAIVALAFTICLVPGVGVHQLVDGFLDSDAPGHLFHGHGIRVGAEEASGPLGLMLHGIRDALVGFAAAFPVTLLGLALGSARRRAATSPSSWTLSGRLAVSAAAVLLVLGLEVTALTFSGAWTVADLHGGGALTHAATVTPVPAGDAAEMGGLRLVTQSANWVRHETPASISRAVVPSDPDRLYLVFTVENPGSQARTFARKEMRLQAPSGTAWRPLADDFPDIRLGPHDSLTTMLIFEVPAPEPGLQLAWLRGTGEARIPISDGLTDRNDQNAVRTAQ